MSKLPLFIATALTAISTFAAHYTLDLTTGATTLDAQAPILRKTTVALASECKPPASIAVGDTIDLALFDDVRFTLKIVSAPPAGIAGQSFIARDENGSASAIVKIKDGGARVFVDDFMNMRQYTVRCKDGVATVTERDNSQTEPDECGTCGGALETPLPSPDESPAVASTTPTRRLLGDSDDPNAFGIAPQKTVVDILVAFDQGAKAWAETASKWDNGDGDHTIEEFADYAVNKMNTVLANSQLLDQFCYRLVGVTEVEGNNTVINDNLLGSVRARTGAFAKLEQLRDKCGADTITLLINRTSGNTAGKGYEYSGDVGKTLEYFEHMRYACNVCDINTVYSRYTMSHETGHNMGCGHSNLLDGKKHGKFDYSYGYNFVDATNQKRYTIMAYDHTASASGYQAVPYFSAPGMTFYASDQDKVGCPLGVEGVNNNRQTLLDTNAETASLREHILPYEWDVDFLDSSGNSLSDNCHMPYGDNWITLYHANPNADIYYTTDGSKPNKTSPHVKSGNSIKISLWESVTISACAIVEDAAQSFRTITITEGAYWSGEAGQNGNGVWADDNTSLAWSNSTAAFNHITAAAFSDLESTASPEVTVRGKVEAYKTAFPAYNTAYTFNKGDEDALIVVHSDTFAPSGDLTFNVPVSLDATSFTLTPNHTVTFNAPFGTNVTANTSYGHCTNSIAFKVCGTTQLGCNLVIAPGENKTQVFNYFDNSVDNNLSTVSFGEGTTIFNGPYKGVYGVMSNAKVVVGNGANLVFNCAAATGSSMTSAFTVEKGGTVTFDGSMEHMQRPLYLNGGTLICNNRFDKMYAYGIAVTDDSEIKGSGRLLLRYNDEAVTVSAGKTLTLNIPTKDQPSSNTSGIGLIKRGDGEIIANQQLEHSGATTIEGGTFTVGYASTDAYGTGWSVASGAKLKVNAGGALTVPSLATASGATLSLPVSASTALTVTNSLDLAGVKLELTADGNYYGGDRFTVITANEGLLNADQLTITATPALADGLKWEFDVSENSVVAWVKGYNALKNELQLVSNNPELSIAFPNDAEVGDNGGVVIDSSPLVVNGLSTKAVAITLDVEIPEGTITEEATICSWKVGDGIARCVRRTDNKLDCFHGTGTDHVANATNFVELTPGCHTIAIAYYSYDNNTHGGTFVYVDNQLAYRGAGLRWSNDYVSRIAVGGTAYDPATRVYSGLVVHGFAIIDALSNEPIPNVTASGGNVKYEYMTQGHPCVFALPPAGGFILDNSILRATLGSSRYDSISVSVAASFPTNKTGTIVGLCLSDSDLVSFQAEYVGDGKFMLRSNDGDYTTYPESGNVDVSAPHLYTIAYDDSNVTFYIDGNLVIESEWYSGEVVNEVDFGCGYWNEWSNNGTDNPNPISGLKVYASNIALDAMFSSVSENAVMNSLGFDSQYYAGMTYAEKLAYLVEQQTANGVVAPVNERLPVVDILVAYDNGAKTYIDNNGWSMEEFAQMQIDKMNEALITNRLDNVYGYRLAGVCRIDATVKTINSISGSLAEGAGAFATLRSQRELCGADTVTLLVDNDNEATLGYGCPLSSSTDVASCHDDAFSVCSIKAVDSGKQHTMLHENAHNMGCGHAHNPANSPFDYGRGYNFNYNGSPWHTIMAYGGDNDASWYFSTTNKYAELGDTVLGNANADNRRVLTETCGDVSDWRESVKPFNDDASVVEIDTGKEILSGHVFATNITVSLSSSAGLPIYYTLDGTNPTKESALYASEPIEITADTTITVATFKGKTMNPPRTVKLFRIDSLGQAMAEGISWRTSLKYPWSDAGDGVVRSCNHTNYKYYCTTPLMATIVGPKRLVFKEKSYFRGTTPSSGSKYSHYEVLVDDIAQVTEEDCEYSWQLNYIDIPEGEHEVAFVYSQRTAMNNSEDNKDGAAAVDDDAVWLKDFLLIGETLDIPLGDTFNLSVVPAYVKTITGEGTLNCGASLPDAKLGFTNETWRGTVAFDGLTANNTTKDFQFELYGNANSKIQLTNCRIPYLKNNDATFAGTLVLVDDGNGTAFSTSDGYSGKFNAFGALEGEGSMSFTGNPTQAYVFHTATNFLGSITVDAADYYSKKRGRKIVFGDESYKYEDGPPSQSEPIITVMLPAQSATITVLSGATASIGADATWYAYHGVEIAGTLRVKGSGATLNCDDNAELIGLNLTDSATIRFDTADAKLTFAKKPTFASGTVKIAFADGVEPTDGQVLLDWSASGNTPAGEFAFDDASLDESWELKKSSTGLIVSAKETGFPIPGTDTTLTKDENLDDWLDGQNYDGETWQEFMAENGANGHPNWVNFLLDLPTNDETKKFEAKIEIVNGEVKITTTEGTIREGYGITKWLHKKEKLGDNWTKERMNDKSITIDAGDGSGFYYISIEIEE